MLGGEDGRDKLYGESRQLVRTIEDVPRPSFYLLTARSPSERGGQSDRQFATRFYIARKSLRARIHTRRESRTAALTLWGGDARALHERQTRR